MSKCFKSNTIVLTTIQRCDGGIRETYHLKHPSLTAALYDAALKKKKMPEQIFAQQAIQIFREL